MIIALLLAAQAANPIGDAIMASMHAYSDCVKTQTLRLGAANSEPGDTVVAAARAECRPQFEHFRATIQIDDSAFYVRSRVDGEALAALLEARARVGNRP